MESCVEEVGNSLCDHHIAYFYVVSITAKMMDNCRKDQASLASNNAHLS